MKTDLSLVDPATGILGSVTVIDALKPGPGASDGLVRLGFEMRIYVEDSPVLAKVEDEKGLRTDEKFTPCQELLNALR